MLWLVCSDSPQLPRGAGAAAPARVLDDIGLSMIKQIEGIIANNAKEQGAI